MKKIIISLMLGIMLISIASASLLTTRTYSNDDLTVQFETLYLDNIGTATLVSHNSVNEIKKVGWGEPKVVMYYDLDFEDIEKDGLGDVKIIDMNTGKIVDKKYDFVIWGTVEYEFPLYEEVCSQTKNFSTTCRKELIRYETREREDWIKYDSRDIPKQARIGLRTMVNEGDYYDAIWTMVDEEITKHSEWTAGLDVNLLDYYNFENGTGDTAIDRVAGEYNMTGIQGSWTTDGGIQGSGSYRSNSLEMKSRTIGGIGDITINMWVNITGNDVSRVIVGNGINSGEFVVREGNDETNLDWIVEDSAGYTDYPITKYQWHMVTLRFNNSVGYFIIDGVVKDVQSINALSNQNLTFGDATGGDPTGSTFYDEIGIWNRTLSTAEITQLYNGGAGIIYVSPDVETSPTVILNIPTDYYNTTSEVDDFELNITFGTLGTNWTNYTFTVWDSVNNAIRERFVEFGISDDNCSESYEDSWIKIECTGQDIDVDGVYHWNTYGCSNNNLCSWSATNSTFTIDTIYPLTNIVYPTAISYAVNVSELNYTASDTNEGSCWYSTDDGVTNETAVSYGTNFTGITSEEGSNTWIVYCNDTFGHENSSRVTFLKDTIFPAIEITIPTATNYSTNISELNYTTSDTNADSCWYSIDNGLTNETIICGNNVTDLTSNEGYNNWTVWANDTFGNLNSSMVTFFKDTTDPVIKIFSPNGTFNVLKNNDTLSLNLSIVEGIGLDTCTFTYNETVNSLNCTNLNETFQYILGKNILFVFANDTFGNNITVNSTWDAYIFDINSTFNTETTEGNLENFKSNIEVQSGLTVSDAFLIYNNISNIGEKFLSGSEDYLLRKNNLLITSTSSPINRSFFWSVHLSNGLILNLSASVQLVNDLSLDNCTTFTKQIFNFTVVDEELQTKLLINVTSIEYAINIFSKDRDALILNISYITRENPAGVCLNTNLSNSSTYSLDAIIKYSGTGYESEYYNIINSTFNVSTTLVDLTLYDLNSSDATQFQLTFTGSDFLPVEDALVSVDRQYIQENVFKTVELPKTDSNGQTILHLVRNDIIYNIRIIKSGEVIGNFENIIAFCEDITIGDCKILLNAFDSTEEIFNYDDELGISFSNPTYNSTTGRITFDFLTIDGTPKNVSVEIERSDIFGNRSVCTNSVFSSGGTLICDTDPALEDASLIIEVFVDNNQVILSSIELDDTNYGDVGYLVFFIMSLCFILIFSSSKSGILIGMLLSLAGGLGLGLLSGNMIGLGASGIWLILIVTMGIWKLNKERIQ